MSTATPENGTVLRPPQHQFRSPGLETEMDPKPRSDMHNYVGSEKLHGKVALVTGGDSGIGRAVCVAFAKEGADIAIAYLDEHDDARETQRLVELEGRKCMLMPGDLGIEQTCEAVVAGTVTKLGKLDILVNNAGEQHPQNSIADISREQLEKTFRTNVFAYFFMAREALKHLKEGGVIINSTSVTAYRGSPHLLDYSATKGAIVAFTRSLALQVVKQGVRVNGVAPGPVWTPLISSTFEANEVATFGSDVPMERAGEPEEIAPSYVFLASNDSSFMTGQVLHPNGGEVINA
ncbi:MAG: SDR family oxidoreductase [Planctomycetia bacterium]|nr:SDR family oxidoreductase [Planctomycetia bacterium]